MPALTDVYKVSELVLNGTIFCSPTYYYSSSNFRNVSNIDNENVKITRMGKSTEGRGKGENTKEIKAQKKGSKR